MEMKFKYSLYHRIFSKIVALIFTGAFILILYGFVHIALYEWSLYQAGFGEASLLNMEITWSLLLNILLLGVFGYIGLSVYGFMLIAYPAFTIRDDAFKLHFQFWSSPWLSWDSIGRVKYWPIPTDLWYISIKGLGLFYTVSSFLFYIWMGGPTILLMSGIEGYGRLITILQEKRPDLFY